MDPVTTIGLASSCLGIVTKIVSMGKQLDTFVKNFRSAPKDIIRLSEQLSIFQEVLAQLEAWLKQQPDISVSMSSIVRKSLAASAVIIEDIHNHVLSVSPKPGEDSITFWGRIRHLWAEDVVKEHERMVSSQFQIFTVLLSLIPIAKWNVESIVQDDLNRELLEKCEADAQSILSAKDNASRLGRITIDDDLGLNQELSVDAEITQTGPYLQNYRSLVHRIRNSTPDVPPDLNVPPSSSRTDEDIDFITSSSPLVEMTYMTVPKVDGTKRPSIFEVLMRSKQKRLREEEKAIQHNEKARQHNEKVRQNNEKVRQYNEKISQLCLHAEYGGIAHMKTLIDNGADVHGRHWGDAGPLEVAITYSQVEAVRFLLGAGADANGPINGDKNKAAGITKPLHLAVSKGSVEIAGLLIDHNAAVQELDAKSNSALHRAASLGSVELVQLLIDHSADVYALGLAGDTPLHIAAGETVSTLLSAGAVIYAKNTLGEQPLVSAVVRGDAIAVQILLSHGAPLNIQSDKTRLLVSSQGHITKDSETPGTPLLMSILESRLEITQSLIAAGADVHQLYPILTSSLTAATTDLFWMICRGYVRHGETHFNSGLAKVLLENGADPVRKSSVNCHTALEELCGPTEEALWDLPTPIIRRSRNSVGSPAYRPAHHRGLLRAHRPAYPPACHTGKLSILRVISRVAPQCLSVKHSNGKHFLVGIWHDFHVYVKAGYKNPCPKWRNHIVSASLILLELDKRLYVTDVDRSALLEYMRELEVENESIESLSTKLHKDKWFI